MFPVEDRFVGGRHRSRTEDKGSFKGQACSSSERIQGSDARPAKLFASLFFRTIDDLREGDALLNFFLAE